VDGHGYKFQRITRTAISAIKPRPPTVTTATHTRGHYGNAVTLTCGVDSLVPFEVRWFKDNTALGNTLYYRLFPLIKLSCFLIKYRLPVKTS